MPIKHWRKQSFQEKRRGAIFFLMVFLDNPLALRRINPRKTQSFYQKKNNKKPGTVLLDEPLALTGCDSWKWNQDFLIEK
jgi:hypothetical protein